MLAVAFLLGAAHQAHSQEPVSQRPLGRDVPVFVPPAAGAPGPGVSQRDNPGGVLTLRNAVALALLQNPVLASFAWDIRAQEARILQAGQRPNPALGVLVEDFGGRDFGGGAVNEPIQSQTTIQLSQLVELGGKRTARRELAALNRDLSSWDYETARIDILTEVTQAFTDVLAAQETLAQIERTTQLVDQVQQSVAARVVAGVVSPIEETRASVALGSVRVEVAKARRYLEASRVRLSLLWGQPTPLFTSVEGALRQPPLPLPALETLAARLQQNPEMARWATELSQREASLRVQRARAVPDISVLGGYRRFTDVDAKALVGGVTMSLPLFDRNKGGIREAELRLVKAAEERRATETRLVAALVDAYAVLAAAYDEVTLLRAAVVPGSQQAFEAVSEGYRLGRFGFLDVLESQRTLIANDSQYLRALSQYRKAIAAVERLIGEPLSPAPSRE
ncbi:MAG: TolC family protein [Cyanobacteria bacterium]|nr:TolC family protein [Cyanobacteriota bacterium]